jgi:hypothetical protein
MVRLFMKTRILVLSSLVVVFGCDKVERDWSKCNEVNTNCQVGYQCVSHRCLAKDAGPDAPSILDGPGAPTDMAGDRGPSPDASSDSPRKNADTAGSEADSPLTAVDAPVDMASDGPVGDAPRACGSDEDCPSNLPLCLNSLCVQCKSNSDCTSEADGGPDDGGAPRGGFCNLKTNQCVGCLSHADCRDRTPVCSADQTCISCADPAAEEDDCAARNPALPACNPMTGACVQCVRTSDCRAKAGDAGVGDAGQDGGTVGGVCSTKNTCVECTSNNDCTADPARAFCLGNACVGCGSAGTNACTGAKPLCAGTGSKAGQCVECTSNAQCPQAISPVCDSNQCRGCKKDSECSAQAGICALDGSCPKSNVIIYAQNSSKCTSSNRGLGTVDFPYCDLDTAVSAASGNASIVRAMGTVAPSKPLTISRTTPLLITGASASTAIINPPSGYTSPVVSITGGEVTLRDLTVTGGQANGVSVSAGTVHINRCYVLNNAGTGIAVGDGVAFDITNTVIAGNGSTVRSGVTLGSYAGTGITRFAFNTVVDNGYGGVVCAAGYSLTGVLATNNGTLNFSANCLTDSKSSTAAPAFGSNYHLTANSPCVNIGGLACFGQDIDGEPRPNGVACDCGADEY